MSKIRQTFTSQIKASNLADVFISPYFLENNLVAPRENPPLTHFGAINLGRNISNTFSFSLSGPIKQIWYTDVKWKTKIVLLMDFFHIGHTFRINLYHVKLNLHFLPKFCISITNEPISTKFSHSIVKLKGK